MLKFVWILLPIAYCLFPLPSHSVDPSDSKLKVLYNSLDPKSISQHLAFFELYGHRPLGQQALQEAWALMFHTNDVPLDHLSPQSLSPSTLSSLVALVNKTTDQVLPPFSEEDLTMIDRLSSHLPHKRLKGHGVKSEKEVFLLPIEEIDLARGLFLSQFESDFYKIRLYEAIIDLMALQIIARLPPHATPENKIQTINRFIFDEMGFRFPPHSLYSKEIDLYTFLPSVLDSHRGVCLGVSILYLCLAQRLSLCLEMITPPGHIYIRYRTPEKTINIETTARGIHLDSEHYLTINTRSLQERTIKEVIGLAHINHGAVYWQKGDYPQALVSYQKAEPYMPNDFLLKELMGYAYLFSGQKEKGEYLLFLVKDHVPDYAVDKETTPEDYLNGYVDAESIKILYKKVDEDRQSILNKKQLLETAVKRYPYFRAGFFHLAVAWIQLHRLGEALEVLKHYHTLHPHDPEANYYLTVLYEHRMDYNKAWEHLRRTESIVHAKQYDPKILKELRKSLVIICPE